jgi:hypothetical protein
LINFSLIAPDVLEGALLVAGLEIPGTAALLQLKVVPEGEPVGI